MFLSLDRNCIASMNDVKISSQDGKSLWRIEESEETGKTKSLGQFLRLSHVQIEFG